MSSIPNRIREWKTRLAERGYIDLKLHGNRKQYVLQALLAAGYLLIVYVVVWLLDENLIVASLGASAFIVFTFPHRAAATPRYLIGGYAVAVFWGVVLSMIGLWINSSFDVRMDMQVPLCTLGFFCTAFCMAVLNLEHPPSAALAITLVLSDQPVSAGITAMVCIAVLCLIRHMLLKRMIDL